MEKHYETRVRVTHFNNGWWIKKDIDGEEVRIFDDAHQALAAFFANEVDEADWVWVSLRSRGLVCGEDLLVVFHHTNDPNWTSFDWRFRAVESMMEKHHFSLIEPDDVYYLHLKYGGRGRVGDREWVPDEELARLDLQ